MKCTSRIAVIIALSCLTLAMLRGQSSASDEILRRNLWNPAFGSQRPAAARPAKEVAALGDAFLGVTLWQMELSKGSDPVRFRGLVHKQDPSGQADWTPRRVDLDTPIQSDSLIRLTIESARKGYLYVIDRDMYSDGKFSKPNLIFPTMRLRGGYNFVEPGFLVEIPDARAKPPAFLVEKTRQDQTAVMLTIIVSPAPIPVLAASTQPVKISEQQVADWERRWGSTAQRIDQKDFGKAYTSAEAAAAQRGSEALRAGDPIPSTLFRLNVSRAVPMVVKVALKLGSSSR